MTGVQTCALPILRIAPAYSGPVIHVLDASRAVGVASALVSDGPQKAELIGSTAADYEAIRIARSGRAAHVLASIDEARANAFPYDPEGKAPTPLKPGLHHFGEWPLRDLKAHIDWTPFFRAWELAGNYPAILTDPVVGEQAGCAFADDRIGQDRGIIAGQLPRAEERCPVDMGFKIAQRPFA